MHSSLKTSAPTSERCGHRWGGGVGGGGGGGGVNTTASAIIHTQAKLHQKAAKVLLKDSTFQAKAH